MLFHLLNFMLRGPVFFHAKLRTARIFLRARLKPSARVLDIGSGHHPWFRSNILVERFLTDDQEREGPVVRGRRPLCQAEATALPFRDKSFDFIYCCHVAEHIDDLAKFLTEIQRVGHAGYIETPNYLFEQLIGTTTHHWALWTENGVLHAERKWIAGPPAHIYHLAHRLAGTYPFTIYGGQHIPELQLMSFWWKDRFDFILHPASEPQSLTKSQA